MIGLRDERAPLKTCVLAFGSAVTIVSGTAAAHSSPSGSRGAAAGPAWRASPSLPPKPPVTWIASPHHDLRPPGSAIDTLVIHDTETPGIRLARTIASHFVNPRSGVSAHFIIGKAGEIVQCVPEERRAFHAGPSLFRGRERVNDFSIGIELVNAQTGTDPFTDAQYDSLTRLAAHLSARFAIPTDRIVGHHDVTRRPHIKRDPAPNFDWDRFLAALGGHAPALAQAPRWRVTRSDR